MSCIGTAGHVDHGKSALVTALTGMDPDRLAEEKARSMTIDLGFAWIRLPSGRQASIVDVPGHESFIKNMLAGVAGIDVALLVVAADEGVMPQTTEHLAILDLLRVRVGVVALTKADLVDDDWLAMVREEVAERLRGTTLAAAPIITCSAISGQGLDALRDALDAALAAADTPRDRGRPRLPIDRVFSITGFGTVVTGTLQDGWLRVGQEVELLPAGVRARIRGLQEHKTSIAEAPPGGRVAVNLAGVTKQQLGRGDVLAMPGQQRATAALDVWLEVVADTPRGVAHADELALYLGAAEVPARVALLDAEQLLPGEAGWAQLRLLAPVVAARGDRFIVREPSPSMTVGGGVVVDPVARRHRRRDDAVRARLKLLARGDARDLVLDALCPAASRGGLSCAILSQGAIERATGLPATEVAKALEVLRARDEVRPLGERFAAVERWSRLRAASEALLARFHAQYPLRAGMPREEWRARLGVAAHDAGDVLAALTAEGALDERTLAGRGAYLALPGHSPRLTPAQERQVDAVLQRFRRDPFAPPDRADVERELGGELLAALVERGTLLKLGSDVLLERGAYEEAMGRVVAYLRTHGTLTVAEARDLLGTSRKYILPLFEHLDAEHVTVRHGDERTLGAHAPT